MPSEGHGLSVHPEAGERRRMRRVLPYIGAAILVCLHAHVAYAVQDDPPPEADTGSDRLSTLPDSLQLRRGETRQLTVGSVEAESRSNSTVVWRSRRPAVATVDQAGLLRARALGTTAILASRGEDTDSVRVKVVDFSPPETAADLPNEPPGFARVTEWSLEGLREEGWTVSGELELDDVRAAGLRQPGSTAGVIRFPRGFRGGRTPAWATFEGLGELGFRELYVSFLVKLSSRWQGHRTGVNKIGFIWMHDNPVVVPNHHTTGRGPIASEIRIQDTPAGARNLSSNVRRIRLRRGVWHRWEILLRANSVDRADGEIHWWIDGAKAGEYHDVVFAGSDQPNFWQTVAWRPTWGGRGDVVKEDMNVWMAHIYVSGRSEP